jgi:hypothetical protein
MTMFLATTAVGQAHAEVTSVYGGGDIFSNEGWTDTPYGGFSVSAPDASPLSYGAPSVTKANIKSWAAANLGDADLYASATPMTQTLRASSATSSNGGTENRVSAVSKFNNHEVTVSPTSSNIGDPVTLKFVLRLDGTMALGNTTYSPGTILSLPSTYGYAASAGTSMTYEVFDLNVDSEVAALTFKYQAYGTYGYVKDQYTDVLTDTFSTSGSYTNNGGDTWTNLAGENIENIISPVPLAINPTTPAGWLHQVDSGFVTITLDTYVGHVLSFGGQLVTDADAWGDLRMYALNDFGSTFDAEVIPLNNAGVELIGLQAGVAQVPELDTYGMMLAGLGLIGFMVRGRRNEEA